MCPPMSGQEQEDRVKIVKVAREAYHGFEPAGIIAGVQAWRFVRKFKTQRDAKAWGYYYARVCLQTGKAPSVFASAYIIAEGWKL